ncbi:MAG TPA: protein-L-isoaspartate(D-aspartate) O-methyltransferase [Saprospiraceae bacterium]|nr:protein-L-isoaspartate(D-aspartate) O-methyltransferase [Saprospiraceae bacterium]
MHTTKFSYSGKISLLSPIKLSEALKDTYRHKGMRRKLVEELRQKGIEDEDVLSAIAMLPRHFFLDKTFEEWAYQDKPFPIGNKQTISQPYTVAYQTALLQVKKRDKILEVGTGSGYQAAILALMGARVFTIERQELLYQSAKQLLEALQLGNVRCFLRDGYKGLPEFAPFDKIIVTAGAEELPKTLLEQLGIGGIMVIPVGKEVQKMHQIKRLDQDNFEEKVLDDFRFVPFLKGLNKL